MKKLLLPITLLLANILYGQNTKIKNLRPVLVAIQVKHLDTTIAFYSKYLGLQLQERKRFDDYHLEIAFLKNPQFYLELVENDSSIDKNVVLKEKNAADMTGFAKISLQSKRTEKFYNFLKSENVNIIVSLRQSTRNKRHQTFIITDPEGNWIQFTGK